MERQGADLQTKIEELQIINHSLRENDKIKEDALAHLSDQLLVLSERIQQLENVNLPRELENKKFQYWKYIRSITLPHNVYDLEDLGLAMKYYLNQNKINNNSNIQKILRNLENR